MGAAAWERCLQFACAHAFHITSLIQRDLNQPLGIHGPAFGFKLLSQVYTVKFYIQYP